MRPCGPEPRTRSRSTPCSCATLRTTGLARWCPLPPGCACCGAAGAEPYACGGGGGAACSGGRAACAGCCCAGLAAGCGGVVQARQRTAHLDDRAFLGDDLDEHARGRRWYFGVGLVGGDLDERLV